MSPCPVCDQISVQMHPTTGFNENLHLKAKHLRVKAQHADDPMESLSGFLGNIFGGLLRKPEKIRSKFHEKGGMSFVYQVNREQPGEINVGFTVVGHKNHFVRKTGVDTATSRLVKKDELYTFMITLATVTKSAIALMQGRDDLGGFTKKFIDNIEFDDLAIDIVEAVLTMCIKHRIDEIQPILEAKQRQAAALAKAASKQPAPVEELNASHREAFEKQQSTNRAERKAAWLAKNN